MLAAIKKFDYSTENEKFATQCEYIEELARKILKPEWERVKAEACGKNKLRSSKKMGSESSKCKYKGYLVTFIVVNIVLLVALFVAVCIIKCCTEKKLFLHTNSNCRGYNGFDMPNGYFANVNFK